MGNMPVKSVRDGAFNCAVFETEIDGRKNYQISLDKGFKRKDSEEWEHQKINLFAEDLLKIASLCERCYWSICELREGAPKQTASAPAPTPAKEPVMDVADGDKIPF